MESSKRLVQSEFEKFKKNCKQRLCKKEEEGTIGRIVSFVSCKVSNRNSKMHSSISLYRISSINNEKHSQFQICTKMQYLFYHTSQHTNDNFVLK
jgi:hypothetical protein